MKRLRASKKFLPIGLLNARSAASKLDDIHHHLLTFDLDVLAITETWLTPEHGDEILGNTIPEGYIGIHVPRVGRQGGGIAVIHRSTIFVNRLPIVFESLLTCHDSKYHVRQNCNYSSTTFSELSKVSL